MKTVFIALLTLLSSAPAMARAADGSHSAPRPNIVFLLVDDQGAWDVGYRDSKVKTPNIDKLCYQGTRFEQFYVQPVCSPTRACLMTGRYPMRYGLQTSVIRPRAAYGLPLEERTLPQALREAGYQTAIEGKWHLGHFRPDYLPTHRGFDHEYGCYNGAINYFNHLRDGGLDWHRDDHASEDKGYSTNLIGEDAVATINNRDKSKPLFLYVPFNGVHSPLQSPESYKVAYKDVPEPRRTYLGQLAAVDEAIGQIVTAIDKAGLTDNTLFIYSSDNGGYKPGTVTNNGPLREGKGTLYEGGVRTCAFATWKGHLKANASVSAPMHIIDWYPTLLKLAGASLEQNLPLDGRDIWPVLTAGKPSPHDMILFNSEPHSGSIRVGDWKIVVYNRNNDERVELYNLAHDLSEKEDLAGHYPDKVKELLAQYDALAKQAVPPMYGHNLRDKKIPKVWGEPD